MENRLGKFAFLATTPSRRIYLALRVTSIVTGLLIASPTAYFTFLFIRSVVRGVYNVDSGVPWLLFGFFLMCHAFMLVSPHKWKLMRDWYPRSLFVMMALSLFAIWLTLMTMSGFWAYGPLWARVASISISIVVPVGSAFGPLTLFLQATKADNSSPAL